MERRRPGDRITPGDRGRGPGPAAPPGASGGRRSSPSLPMPLGPLPSKPDLPPPPPKPVRPPPAIAPPGSSNVRAEEERQRAERHQGTARRRVEPPPPHSAAPRKKPRREPEVAPHEVCRVVFADDWVVVVDKAAGYPVNPSGPFHQRSVVLALQAQGYAPCFPIHLLDAEASGLVVLSRSPEAAKALRWNWRSELCERSYVAIVRGDIPGGRGRISLAIGAARQGHRTLHKVMAVEEGGRAATTEWRLQARGRGYSRLLCKVRSGRCHQIRIHLAAMGFPVVNERLYSRNEGQVPLEALVDLPGRVDETPTLPPHQIGLHCQRIVLPHPMTQQVMEWQAPLPRALTALMPGAWVVENPA